MVAINCPHRHGDRQTNHDRAIVGHVVIAGAASKPRLSYFRPRDTCVFVRQIHTDVVSRWDTAVRRRCDLGPGSLISVEVLSPQ